MFPGIGRGNLDPNVFKITSISGFDDTLFTPSAGLRKTISVFRSKTACAELDDADVGRSVECTRR